MSSRPVALLVEDVWEAIEKIERYTVGLTCDDFSKDEKTIDAVVRNLEIIGEASNRFPNEFTDRHPEIEWRQIVGLRHRIVHEYFGVDREIIWHIIQHDLPRLKSLLTSLRRPLEDRDKEKSNSD